MAAGFHHFLVGFVSIVVIDLLLCGDNALVIALAVRSLPKSQRRVALMSGAGLAILIRVAVTFVAAKLLEVAFIQLAGGAYILWIAVKVLVDAGAPEEAATSAHGLWRAIGSIVLADLTMSIDNILAVAGASRGSIGLILFGLGLSIPLVIFSSTLLSVLMDKYPLILYLGSAILGRVGGEMILTDAYVRKLFQPSDALRYAIEAALIAAILLAGRVRRAPAIT